MTEPVYTARVQHLRAACQHFLDLLDHPQPIEAWRQSVQAAWEAVSDASSGYVADSELERKDADGE